MEEKDALSDDFDPTQIHDALKYVIWLENEQGQKGYLQHLASWDGQTLRVSDDVSGALMFDSQARAESCLLRLEEQFGLNREEALIRLYFVDREFTLRLFESENADEDDSIAVKIENGKYFIDVSNMGIGSADEIDEQTAQLLVLVLLKLGHKLRGKPRSQNNEGQ